MRSEEIIEALAEELERIGFPYDRYTARNYVRAVLSRLAEIGMSEEAEIAGWNSIDGDLGDDADRLRVAFTAALRSLSGGV